MDFCEEEEAPPPPPMFVVPVLCIDPSLVDMHALFRLQQGFIHGVQLKETPTVVVSASEKAHDGAKATVPVANDYPARPLMKEAKVLVRQRPLPKRGQSRELCGKTMRACKQQRQGRR
jgi:hypothetical protein